MNIGLIIEKYILDSLKVGDHRKDIDHDESLIAKGVIDSLFILQLVSFLEEEFDVTIDDNEVTPDNFETINVMESLIGNKLQQDGEHG
ncbi:MAG TPA: acyl carrier protein [Anaerolineales bacterium]|nr:acyl carrier protein [Anaerolineales bacterium]